MILVLGAMACQDQQEAEDDEFFPKSTRSYPGVEEAFWPYFENFERAADDRGILIDLASLGITAGFEESVSQEPQIVGMCQSHPDQGEQIIIDLNEWKRTTQFRHEFMLFHELGHCVLNRGHFDEAYPSGICKSIMRSGEADCFDYYNASTRSTYLDELFQ